MEKISNKVFGGERPLFEIHNVELDHVRITFGESGIKECSNIVCRNCYFEGKYPLWHVKGSDIRNCYFAPGSRSAIWYSDDMHMEDCVINGPKFFREMKNLSLKNVTVNDADETFWGIDGLTLENVVLHEGTYPFMHCRNVKVDGLVSDAKYVFQYSRDIEIRNADRHEGLVLGGGQRDGVRLGAERRVPRMALARTATRQLPYIGRTAALLRQGPGARELHIRRRMRPRVRVFYRAG